MSTDDTPRDPLAALLEQLWFAGVNDAPDLWGEFAARLRDAGVTLDAALATPSSAPDDHFHGPWIGMGSGILKCADCGALVDCNPTSSSAPDRHAGEATAPIYHLPSAPDVEGLRADWANVRSALPRFAVGPNTAELLAAADRIDAALRDSRS